MRLKKTGLILSLMALMYFPVAAITLLEPEALPVYESDYESYRARLESVQTIFDIYGNGFIILEDQIYKKGEFNNFGKVEIIPALDSRHRRIVFFFSDEAGRIVYKTDELECNNQRPGELDQPNLDIAGFGLRDLNGDGLMDIVVISRSFCQSGPYAGIIYTIGDVLYQSETGFYRDWRLSGRINRFGMNIDVNTVIEFARDGNSAEFLYLADTLDELIRNEFNPIHERAADFETFGEVRLLYGTYTYRMAGYHVFMIYLADRDGNLLWNFQPMGQYTNFSSIGGFRLEDVNGDGRTDLILLLRYDTLTPDWETVRVTDYLIYHQQNGYFERDWEFQKAFRISEDDTVSDIVEKASYFWRNR